MKSKKQIDHDYYMKKGRFKRKFKGATEIPHIRCFMCGKLIDYQKYLEKRPTIRIDMKLYRFGGRSNIKVINFSKIDPEIEEFVRNVLISKLKSMLWALEQRIEPLQPVIETPMGKQIYETTFINAETQVNAPMEVKYGN